MSTDIIDIIRREDDAAAIKLDVTDIIRREEDAAAIKELKDATGRF